MILGTVNAKCGSIDTTHQVLDEMPQRNIIKWSTMISAYEYHGQGKRIDCESAQKA